MQGRPRLQVVREFDPWRGPLCTCPPKYSLQPYTRCSHLCLYCYATAYLGRGPSVPKQNLLQRLRRDLRYLDLRKPINLSTSSDPYPPEEREYQLTRRVLELLVRAGARILITTKSDLVLRDLDLLRSSRVAVMITITTLDENLAKYLEPGVPRPSERLRAVEVLSGEGIPVGVRVDPIIPHLNDDESQLRELVREVVSAGAKHIVTSTYKARPDSLHRLSTTFPDLAEKWRYLYRCEGEYHHGYWYLRSGLRRRLLRPIIEEARRLGVTYATCREGFPDYTSAPTCDGTHLIPQHGIESSPLR